MKSSVCRIKGLDYRIRWWSNNRDQCVATIIHDPYLKIDIISGDPIVLQPNKLSRRMALLEVSTYLPDVVGGEVSLECGDEWAGIDNRLINPRQLTLMIWTADLQDRYWLERIA